MFSGLRHTTTSSNGEVTESPNENRTKWLRYELPYTVKTCQHREVLDKIETPYTMIRPSIATIKKLIKKTILLRYPTTCYLQECPMCAMITEDIFYPRKEKKQRKKKAPKKKCNPGCICSIKCRAKIIAQNNLQPPLRAERPFPLFLPNILVNNILNVPPPIT
jgi:hypothetical protein